MCLWLAGAAAACRLRLFRNNRSGRFGIGVSAFNGLCFGLAAATIPFWRSFCFCFTFSGRRVGDDVSGGCIGVCYDSIGLWLTAARPGALGLFSGRVSCCGVGAGCGLIGRSVLGRVGIRLRIIVLIGLVCTILIGVFSVLAVLPGLAPPTPTPPMTHWL